jgi:Uma2 family endonuclease
VTCTAWPLDTKLVRDPVMIFEVLSPSTASTDILVKNREYAATPSVRRHMLLAQERIGGQMFERTGDDRVGHVVGPETILKLHEIDIEVPIAEFFRYLDLTGDGDL